MRRRKSKLPYIMLFAVVVMALAGSFKEGEMRERHKMSFGPAMLTSVQFTAEPEKFDDLPEVPAPTDHPPLSIVIGAHVWTVHYSTNEAFDFRMCSAFENNQKRQIWLPRHFTSHRNQRESLLHEILHASLKESRDLGANSTYSQDENSFVQPMAAQFLQVMQDNPRLVEWLQQLGPNPWRKQ